MHDLCQWFTLLDLHWFVYTLVKVLVFNVLPLSYLLEQPMLVSLTDWWWGLGDFGFLEVDNHRLLVLWEQGSQDSTLKKGKMLWTFYLTIKFLGDIITLKDVKWLSENVKVKTRLKGATSYNTRFSEFCCCCDRARRVFEHPANKEPTHCVLVFS